MTVNKENWNCHSNKKCELYKKLVNDNKWKQNFQNYSEIYCIPSELKFDFIKNYFFWSPALIKVLIGKIKIE